MAQDVPNPGANGDYLTSDARYQRLVNRVAYAFVGRHYVYVNEEGVRYIVEGDEDLGCALQEMRRRRVGLGTIGADLMMPHTSQ